MALCDICNKPGMGTVINTKDMSRAVQSGFNPFKEGLAPDFMQSVGMGSSYNDWRQAAISGRLSMSDWNVCDRCMEHLKPYLEKESKCFIATAACGPHAKEIIILRRFRDTTLLNSLPGRLFAKIYYKTSPSIASLIEKSPKARYIVRNVIIQPLTGFLDNGQNIKKI